MLSHKNNLIFSDNEDAYRFKLKTLPNVLLFNKVLKKSSIFILVKRIKYLKFSKRAAN